MIAAARSVVSPAPQPMSITVSPALRRGGLEQVRGDFREQPVLAFLHRDPAPAGLAVPIGGLIGVGGVEGGAHAGLASGLPFSTT